MSSLQSQAIDYRTRVLRLKELLDRVHKAAEQLLPDNPTVKQVADTFRVDWIKAKRFWEKIRPGGGTIVRSIAEKSNQPELGTETVELLATVPDGYKGLVFYSVETINLVFDVIDVFRSVSQRMSATQFSDCFGENRAFVLAVVMRNRMALKDYTAELDSQIRSVLASTEWTTAKSQRPKANKKVVKISKPKRAKADRNVDTQIELKRAIEQIRPQFASDYAMTEKLGVHRDSLSNALTGKGKPSVVESILRKAQKYISDHPSRPASSEGAAKERRVEVREPQSFIGSFITSLNAFVRMCEAVGMDPDMFTDGDRMQVMRFVRKLLLKSGIDEATINRLTSAEPSTEAGPNLEMIIRAAKSGRS